MSAGPLTLLVDNGSLQPAATLALRELAAALSRRLQQPVEPISLLHSSGIKPELLNGQEAEILVPALERRLAAGQNDFILVPLFFGPSQALTVYLPENFERLKKKFPEMRITVARHLHAPDDPRLARILADQVRAEIDILAAGPAAVGGALRPDGSKESGRKAPPTAHGQIIQSIRVALVDHGSPIAPVTAVRNELAQQLAEELGSLVATVAACSMERRPDPAYDFCDPLLAALLATPSWSESRVIVAMQFLLPGRHAGPQGDVARICQDAEGAHPNLRPTMTKLVAEHPLLIDILVDRWKAVAR